MDYTASRYVPAGAARVAAKSGAAVAYLYTTPRGRPAAIGYRGKGGKPSLHYTYASAARRAESVAQFLRSADAAAASRTNRAAERRAKLAKPHGLQVGDVLSCSWGYEQTNLDYFEVTRVPGARSVEIRKIACQSEDTNYMQGISVPAKGRYVGEPMVKRVDEDDSVRIYSFARAYKLQPQRIAGMDIYRPQSWSSYA